MPFASHATFLGCLQAFVKARGDGLGYDLIKAEFHFDGGVSSNTASVWIDGEPQSRWATLPNEPTLVGTSRSHYLQVLMQAVAAMQTDTKPCL